MTDDIIRNRSRRPRLFQAALIGVFSLAVCLGCTPVTSDVTQPISDGVSEDDLSEEFVPDALDPFEEGSDASVVPDIPEASDVESGHQDTSAPETTGPCQPVSPGPGSPLTLVDAEVMSAIGTVVRVRWETAEPTRGHVLFGLPGDLSMTTTPETTKTKKHEALLLGLHASTSYEFQVFTETDGQVLCAEVDAVETGPLSPQLPPLHLTTSGSGAGGEGYTVVPVLTAQGGGYTVIVDREGEVVWYWNKTGLRAYVTRDRSGVAFMWQAPNKDQNGAIHRVSFDGVVSPMLAVPGIHTDFVELADGTFAALGWEMREFEGGTRKILGETIKEITPDGNVTVIWSIFDDLEPDLNKTYPTGFYGNDVEEWTHINGITFDETEGAYYVTSRHMDAVLKVHRETGLEWVLSGAPGMGDFEVPVGLIRGPHSVQRLEDSLLVFNSNYGNCSGAVELRLDADASTCISTWSYLADGCLSVNFLGNAQRLANGNTLVVSSSSGQIDEASPDGELLWKLNLGFGVAFGFGERIESLY